METDKWWNVNDHSRILVEIIKTKTPKIIAEIGVFEARNARFILRNCSNLIQEYWGFDKYNTSWKSSFGYQFPRETETSWDDRYKRACKYMPFFPQFRLLKMGSEEAVNLFPKRFFPNGYFDFVYIDADHSYEAVKTDITLWLPLVKVGGLIGGHDYGFPENAVRHNGVKKAVDEIFGESNVIVYKREGVWLVEH